MNATALGWNSFFERHFRTAQYTGYEAARIAAEHKNLYHVATVHGEMQAIVSGRFQHIASSSTDYPAVGDWVVVTMYEEEHKAIIHEVLPRKSRFSRNAPGSNFEEQIVAANIDIVCIATSLNRDYNIRRLERYLTMAWEGGASPVVLLTKADLGEDIDEKKAEVESIARDVPVHIVSAVTGDGLNEIQQYFQEGITIAVLGSSGVGKSTLINAIVGEEILEVSAIGHYKDKGQHTTTHRQMIVLGTRGILIDTPGMRELQLWDGSEGISKTFEDIEEIGRGCRFADCSHEDEPGCSVLEALEDGSISFERYESYRKLQREIGYHERRQKRHERKYERKSGKVPYSKASRKFRWEDSEE